MSTPLATTMSLYLAGDSLLAPGAPGRPANSSVGDLFGALNGMPILNAAGGGYQMKDAALVANGNSALRWAGPKPAIILLSAGSNDAGQHQDSRALDAFELSLRYFMDCTSAASRVSEQSYLSKTGTWADVPLDLYGSGKRCWTASANATRTIQFTGKEAVFTVWGFDDSKFTSPWTGGAAFKIHDENNVLVHDGTVAGAGSSNRCYNSPYFSPTAGHLIAIPIRVVFDTYGVHSLKITNHGTSTQQLWVDDIHVIGSVKPIVHMPLVTYSHENFLLYTNPNLTDAVVDTFRARQQAVAADYDNLDLLDLWGGITDDMYHTDWYHLNGEGHEKLLDNWLAAVPNIAFSAHP